MVRKIDFQEAVRLLEEEKNAVLLDVREEDEYITGHAVDALLLPVDEITPQRAADLLPDREAPILVYCRSGRRSRRAAKLLDSFGYTQLYDLGSLIGWPYGLE